MTPAAPAPLPAASRCPLAGFKRKRTGRGSSSGGLAAMDTEGGVAKTGQPYAPQQAPQEAPWFEDSQGVIHIDSDSDSGGQGGISGGYAAGDSSEGGA
jgi:hypothetical protein